MGPGFPERDRGEGIEMRRRRRTWSAALAPLWALSGFVLVVGCAEREPGDATEPAASAADAGAAAESDAALEEALLDPEDAAELEPVMDPEAVEVVKRMVQALAGAQALGVVVDEEYDALQADGRTLSFGKTVAMTMRRPDRLRVETSERGGAQRVASFDGRQITVFDSGRNAFASTEHAGEIDSLVDFLRDEVGLKLPLAPMFSTQFGALLLENVTSALYVDEETLDGVALDHVAFGYGEGLGVQLWVPREGDALPRRIVMTFEDAPGRPQFRADFREWKLAPDVADAVFTFAVPEGARRIAFVLPKAAAAKQPPSAGGEGS
jgi:hypothetical protein